MIRVASFDIGKKNFAFLVQTFPVDVLISLPHIYKKDRYKPDGSIMPEFSKIVENISICGKVEIFKCVDLTYNCDKSSYLDPETFHNMTDFLRSYDSLWDKCSLFLVERQMSARNKYNTMALKLGQHCLGYFRIRYGRIKEIHEYPAYHKTQVLGAPKPPNKRGGGLTKTQRKKWAVTKTLEILEKRKDNTTLSQLNTVKKKDDIADCLLQALSAIILLQQNRRLQ